MDKKERRKQLYGGRSTKAGIVFYGKKYAVSSYFDPDNGDIRNIVFEKGKNYVDKSEYDTGFKFKWNWKTVVLMILLAALCVYAVYIELDVQRIIYERSPFIYNMIASVFQILAFAYFAYVLISFQLKETIETKKFHAAEHMVAKSFSKFGYIPDVDEIKKIFRYHPRCGICKLSNVLFYFNLSFILHFAFDIYIIPFSVLAILLCFVPYSINPYSFLVQILVSTKKPDEKHILLAKKCYEKLLSLELETEDAVIYDNEEAALIRIERADANLRELVENDMLDPEEALSRMRDELEDIDYQIKIEKMMF